MLIATKLHSPRLREGLVPRPELVERLRAGRARALTLVCAPAGYGKTTLLAQWEAEDRSRTPFAWISLDERDTDPLRLWSHVIAGLREAHGPAGETSLPELAAGPRAVAERVLPLLIDELADAPPLVLVVDDWHAVRNPLCDQTMASFVERAPAAVQIVISSRADPGLHVARLRAHGELAEVRAGDLRLSFLETAALLRAAGVQLDPRDVARLTERTEGWLAGLCLALLVVKEQPDPRRFVADFSGTTRHVLDYLARDVLDAVAPEVRDFLVRTSLLEHLSPALCNAVLETSDSAAMLAEVERANLFLVSLDAAGTEYRYHQLFAAMLQRELEATAPEAVPALHARASQWYEETGDIEPAIEHAIASRDVALASRLVTRYGQVFWTSGRVATMAVWLAALSWPAALADRQLALVRAQVYGLAGHGRDEMERWLAIAEAGPDAGPLPNGVASLRSGVAILRAVFLTRGVEAAETEARRALELELPHSPWRRPTLAALGQALYLRGRHHEARAPLDHARALPGAGELAPATALCLSYLALVELAGDDGAEAERLARGALALLEERHLSSTMAAVNPHLALGCVLAGGPDLPAAIDHLEQSLALSAPAGTTYWHAHALLRLASARHRLGDHAAAQDALALARVELDELPDLGMLGDLYEETSDELRSRRRRDGVRGDELSEAELRILRRLADGSSLGEIAHELWLSPNTVKTHRRSIYRKLGVSTRAELLERVAEQGTLHGRAETDAARDGARSRPRAGS